MKRSATKAAVIGAALALTSGLAQAQSGIELGKSEYLSKCGACHGASGKGDGYFTEFLKVKMPDLTAISKKSGGIFPADRLMRVIDGRETIRPHGPVSMPIWGSEYSADAAHLFKSAGYDPEPYIRVRILALTDYLYQLQAK